MLNRREFLKTGATGLISLSSFPLLAGAGNDRNPVNLLFIMTDQQRWDTLSIAGNRTLETPNLDRIGREGVYFKTAYSGCPICVPARTVMLTGLSIENCKVRGNTDYGNEDAALMPSFDMILADNGYETEYYGKWHAPYRLAGKYRNTVFQTGKHTPKGMESAKAHYVKWLDKHVPNPGKRPGWVLDKGTGRYYKPDPPDLRYGDVPESELPRNDRGRITISQATEYGFLDIPTEFSRTGFTVNETIEALEQLKNSTFSLTCSIGPPHPPMLAGDPYYSMFKPEDMPIPPSIGDPMTDSPYRKRAETMVKYRDRKNVQHMKAVYYAMVKEIDDHVGRLLDRLDELGLSENTLVIFTSDHGEMLGSHGMHSKGILYEESVHIPLLMRLPPAIRPGTVVTRPVSQIDLYSTILDYCGVKGGNTDGESLRPLIAGTGEDGPDYTVSEWRANNMPNFVVRTEKWKLMFANRVKSPALNALYDMENDPYEMNNLLKDNEYRGIAESMKERLIAWLEKTDSPHLKEVIARQL